MVVVDGLTQLVVLVREQDGLHGQRVDGLLGGRGVVGLVHVTSGGRNALLHSFHHGLHLHACVLHRSNRQLSRRLALLGKAAYLSLVTTAAFVGPKPRLGCRGRRTLGLLLARGS